MDKIIFFSLLLICSNTFGQSWTIGDINGYNEIEVDKPFNTDSKVIFDIDNDGLEDINISSHYSVDINDWSRLSFSMNESVECVMLNPGFITAFEKGESLDLLNDDIYQKNLDFICGYGKAGGYGQFNIQEKYLVFRKKTEVDTNYIFISFSNSSIDFTIHSVISKNMNNPIDIISSIDLFNQEEINIFPNPASHVINLSIEIERLTIYNLNGEIVLNVFEAHQNINLNQLNTGLYIIELMNQGKSKKVKLTIE